jgi:hypothetical protein
MLIALIFAWLERPDKASEKALAGGVGLFEAEVKTDSFHHVGNYGL